MIESGGATMSELIRWEPYREMTSLRELMDRVFEEPFSRAVTSGMLGGPAIDLYQTEDEVVVKASLPGVKADEINVSITGDVLTIRGAVQEEKSTKESMYHLRERRYGSFSRTIPLPTVVVADKAKAEFEDGILTLTLPKAEELRPKTISVKAK
jgi:HSP20 family protein